MKKRKKRALMVATVAATIGTFNMKNLHILKELGYDVDVAADFSDESTWTKERLTEFKDELKNSGIRWFEVGFSRSLLKPVSHIKAYLRLKTLIKKGGYSIIHTQTPIASVIARLASKDTGARVIYTAHGFHFYNGAPIINWLIFYPLEKWLSLYTDVLITINKEDYKRAKRSFYAKKTVYVPGIGVDVDSFLPKKGEREKTRSSLGVEKGQIVLLSVGELNKNKNHISVIRALRGKDSHSFQIDEKDIVYVIAGKGEAAKKLKSAAKEAGVNLLLLGYRQDVASLYAAADIYILPSIREGLNVSLMEAMAAGLACAAGRIRGNTDLIKGEFFNPKNAAQIRTAISNAYKNKKALSVENLQRVRFFDTQKVCERMRSVYTFCDEGGCL